MSAPPDPTDAPAAPAVEADDEREWLRAALHGRFELVRPLGRGAVGTVYLALERTLQRWVAVKALRRELGSDPAVRERFRREALTNARLEHPNIVPIYAFGELGGVLYFAMRYVRGPSLAHVLKRGEPLPADEACRILADLATALDYAHRQRVVHRDIKPENVLLDPETRQPLLTDFGVARAVSLDAMRADEIRAERGRLYGTVYFMSPEQVAGETDPDGRSDLYGLGVLGYALLSGRFPFEGATVQEVLALHATAPPPPLDRRAPHAPPAAVAAIMRCLAKAPEDRWPDGRALREALLATIEPAAGRSPLTRAAQIVARAFRRRGP